MTSNSRGYEPSLAQELGLAHAIQVTFVAILTSALAISGFSLLLRWHDIPQLALMVSVSSIVALVLTRSGRIKLAMLLVLIGITYTVMHAAARGSGIENIGLAILPVLIVVSALLLDRLTILFFTTTAILATLGMLAIRYFVLRAERYSMNDMGDFVVFALTCATAALVGRLFARRIEDDFRQIRDSESRYRRIFENVQDVYFEMRTEGVLLELSPASAALFGVSREEMIGGALEPFCVNRSEFDALLGALHLHGRVSNCDLIIRDSHAKLHHVLVSASLQKANTRDERVIGSIRDISERKGMEEELRRRAEELQKIMDVAPVALFMANDPECREVIVNRMGNVMLELPEGTNSHASPGGPLPPCPFFRNGMEIPVQELPLQTAARGVDVRDCELEARLPSGKRRLLWGHASPLRDGHGQVRGAIAAFQDVTEVRQRTDAILRESEYHLKNAERLAHVGHWQWDLRTNRVSGSDEMFRIFGKPQDYIPSYEGFLQDLIPNDRERVEGLIRDSLTRKIGDAAEYQIAHPNGDLRTILCIWEVKLDEEGMPNRVFGTCQDITDSRRAQEESFARQKLESVGTLASGIAHDFNNLLGAVVAQAELGMAEFDAGSSPKEELRCIREVAIRGSEIVRQLMIYAGKESGVAGLSDVSQIVEEMIALVEVSVSKHVTLETDLGKDLPAVQANAAQLRQIVMNLIMNASDAIGDRDGVIRVTTRSIKEGRNPSGDVFAESDYLQLEISDNGSGMSQELQARVFDPFFTTKPAGHGLGLSVVRGIVRDLHGSIHLTSEPAKGTTFKVLLPCAESKARATSQPMASAAWSARSPQVCTVLLVEDEDVLRQAVFKMLRKNGFEVLEAASGSAAVDLLRAHGGKIDVMLLDMTIPGSSSNEVVAEAARARPDIRVILTSAYSLEMLTPPLSASQIRGFVRKPFQLEDLVQTLWNSLAS